MDDIVRAFPDWMGPDLPAYAGRAAQLPFDEHALNALVAPRVLFDSEAQSDIWANPLGAYQSNIAAREVYRFLGVEENLLWYWREGYHAPVSYTHLDVYKRQGTMRVRQIFFFWGGKRTCESGYGYMGGAFRR